MERCQALTGWIDAGDSAVTAALLSVKAQLVDHRRNQAASYSTNSNGGATARFATTPTKVLLFDGSAEASSRAGGGSSGGDRRGKSLRSADGRRRRKSSGGGGASDGGAASSGDEVEGTTSGGSRGSRGSSFDEAENYADDAGYSSGDSSGGGGRGGGGPHGDKGLRLVNLVSLTVLHCDGLVGVHLAGAKRLMRAEVSHCASLKAIRLDGASRLQKLTANFCPVLEKVGPLGGADSDDRHASTNSETGRKSALSALTSAEFNGARLLPEAVLYRLVDHCRDLRRLIIIGACEGGGSGAHRGGADQQIKAKIKGNKGRRHKNGNYKEDSRSRVRAKTTSGLRALQEKRPGLLTVVRSKREQGKVEP